MVWGRAALLLLSVVTIKSILQPACVGSGAFPDVHRRLSWWDSGD